MACIEFLQKIKPKNLVKPISKNVISGYFLDISQPSPVVLAVVFTN